MEFVCLINPADLASLLTSDNQSDLLLIYAKSQKLGMNDTNIKNSILMSVNMRRKRINFDNYLSTDQQKLITENIINRIVVYDYDSPSLYHVAENLDIQSMLKAIWDKFGGSGISLLFLKGGLQNFSSAYPHLCNIDERKTSSIFLEPPSTPQEKKLKVEPSMLLPWLYLGEMDNAKNPSILSKYKFTHLLNVAADRSSRNCKDLNSNLNWPDSQLNLGEGFEDYWTGNFVYKHFQIFDDKVEDVLQYFEPSFEYIDSCKAVNGRCLVYCQAGISRSPTICVGYLMDRLGQDLWLALEAVKRKRPVVNPNFNFSFQLTTFNEECKKKWLSSLTVQTLDHANSKLASQSRRHSCISTKPSYFVYPDSENQVENLVKNSGNSDGNSEVSCLSSSNHGVNLEKTYLVKSDNHSDKFDINSWKIGDNSEKLHFVFDDQQVEVTPILFKKCNFFNDLVTDGNKNSDIKSPWLRRDDLIDDLSAVRRSQDVNIWPKDQSSHSLDTNLSMHKISIDKYDMIGVKNTSFELATINLTNDFDFTVDNLRSNNFDPDVKTLFQDEEDGDCRVTGMSKDSHNQLGCDNLNNDLLIENPKSRPSETVAMETEYQFFSVVRGLDFDKVSKRDQGNLPIVKLEECDSLLTKSRPSEVAGAPDVLVQENQRNREGSVALGGNLFARGFRSCCGILRRNRN